MSRNVLRELQETQAKTHIYTSNQICRIFGVTLRQLQWWDEHNIIVPHHLGHSRQYTEHEGIMVGLLGEIRRKGYSLQRFREIRRGVDRQVAAAESDFVVGSKLFLLMLTPSTALKLRWKLEEDTDLLIDACCETGGPVAVIDLGSLIWKARRGEPEKRKRA
jgi:DNA-binding transcriptional MerR regulator